MRKSWSAASANDEEQFVHDVVDVAHLMGPMWSVAGLTVIVPEGEEAGRFLLSEVAALVEAPGPWPVRVVDGSSVVDLVLGINGSVVTGGFADEASSRLGALSQEGRTKQAHQGIRTDSGSSAGVGKWFGRWWWVIAIGLAIAAIVSVAVLFIGWQLTADAATGGEDPTTVSVIHVDGELAGVPGGRS